MENCHVCTWANQIQRTSSRSMCVSNVSTYIPMWWWAWIGSMNFVTDSWLTWNRSIDLPITKPNTRFFIRRSPPWITQSRLAFSVDLLRSNFMSKSSRNHHQVHKSWTFRSLPNDGSWREETGGDSSDTKSVLPSYNFPKFFCRQRKVML
jgi:hypothetical protein